MLALSSSLVALTACGDSSTGDQGDGGDGGSGCPPNAACAAEAASDVTQVLPDTGGRDAPLRDVSNPPACSGATHSAAAPGPSPPQAPAVTVPAGYTLVTIAQIGGARQLAALPNGDLLVATSGTDVYLVPNAEVDTGNAGAPVVFTTINDSPVQGVAFDGASCKVFVASHAGVYAMQYADAQQSAAAGQAIAHVRTGPIAPNSDGDVHVTSSVGVSAGKVFAGVGSSCNACTEVDPTRATVQEMDPNGANMTTKATRFRNAIALATNTDTGTLWAGGAGQDNLVSGHPYEFFDGVTLHAGLADYGWPDCEENHIAYVAGSNCTSTVAPLIVLPAYSTIIGAAYYPASPTGSHAFAVPYRGGFFLAAHGSWHTNGAGYYSPPRVAFVPMNGDTPQTPVNWSDPSAQWLEVIGGFQLADGTTRIGRPTGLAVGAQGSLFVADDQNGLVYRLRSH
jgi:glucose/arabinose dehydrogenase